MNAKILAGAALVALLAAAAGPQTLPSPAGPALSFDHFYDHAALTKALRDLQSAYPGLMTLVSIGKSVQGRDLWAAVINNPKTGPAGRKPGYYIDGNIHGNEIQGGEVALYAVQYLLRNYGRTEFVTQIVDRIAFYIVPTMNPDSRDYYLHRATDPDSPRSGLIPFDDDRDGLADEDGPDDLDGDGSITEMRKRDPAGNLKPHPDDPRLLVPVKPGEKGSYVLLGAEGIDNDGDGLVNEDGPGGYDMNRSYGYNWQPHYVQYGAGDYPFCWPETAAVRDFLLAHPNILGSQNFHNFGGMILRGPGAKNLGEYPAADVRVYDAIGRNGEKIIPNYRYVVVYKDMYTVYGGSIDFLYATLGVYAFSNELDVDMVAEITARQKTGPAGAPDIQAMLAPGARLDELFYHDRVLMGEDYAPWRPAKHPLYGDIEIGGTKKLGRRVPPLFRLAETCHRNAAFCLYHADQLAKIGFDRVEAAPLGGGVSRIDVTVINERPTPTLTAIAAQKKLHRPDWLRVEGPGIELIGAGLLVDKYRGLTQPAKTVGNALAVASGVPGYGRLEYRLLVKGKGRAAVVYDSLKGGFLRRDVALD